MGFCGLIFLASLFHSSALVLLLLPVFKRIKATKRSTLLVLGTAFIVSLCIFKLLSAFGLHDNPYYKYAIQKESLSIIGLVEGAMMFLIVFLSYFLQKRNREVPIDRNVYAVQLLALCVSIILPVFYAFARINDYLWPIILITFLRYAYPGLIERGSPISHRNRLVRQVSGLVMTLVFVSKLVIVNTYRPEWLHIVPYKTYDFSSRYHYYHLYPQE